MRKILVLGTGGTISCAASENGLKPAVSIAELVKHAYIPNELQIELETEQLFDLDSTNMTTRHWEALAKRIRERYDEFDGFVVTHGTDTMAYAAGSLACLIQNSRKPIVFTGSMLPMNREHSDADLNLSNAIFFAADEHVFGVSLVSAGKLFDGKSVSKVRTSFEAFDGKPFPKNVHPAGETRFYDRLSDDVFHVKLIPGQELLIPENAKAVILESYGSGGIPDYYLDTVGRLAEKGVYIIIATQCFYGWTNIGLYEVGAAAAKRFELIETEANTSKWLQLPNGYDY